ncbi:MAG: hypothetical protein ABJN69_11850 [Hellea sp.]
MEIIPFLIFAFIAFKVFSAFNKVASSEQGKTAKEMMRQLNEQIQASKGQGSSSNIRGYTEKGPTARGRERMAMRNQHSSQNSPWDHEHDLGGGPLSPGAKVAAEYLKKAQTKRRASHKNVEQHGRRGMNMDQNKNRTDSWGERGDSGFLNGTTLVILLVIGGGVLYWLSQLPAS